MDNSSRRRFLSMAGAGVAAMALAPDFSLAGRHPSVAREWVPTFDRKVRVGLVGYGASKFGAAFGFQNHPNVEVVAVSDLFPDRCTALAKATNCKKTYPSLEELVKDDSIEAVFVATDAPSHSRHCIEVLKHGKHVATAVPVAFGSIEEGEELLEVVRKNRGLKFMMFETSCFRENLHAMRQIYHAGGFGKLVYSEGEYYHGASLSPQQHGGGIGSYKNWRNGLPPQWYPTHSNAYYIGVTGDSFTEVSCLGMRNTSMDPSGNQYKNPFKTEVALFRTRMGGMSRMAVSWETPGTSTETGRVRGTEGSYDKAYEGTMKDLPDLAPPALPPQVPTGGHGGSHGRLMNEFIMSILEDRKPLVDIVMALNMTVSGIVAHASALKDGELMKVPQYSLEL